MKENNQFFLSLQAVFERLVDIICDKMSESLDSDPTLMAGGANKGNKQTKKIFFLIIRLRYKQINVGFQVLD